MANSDRDSDRLKPLRIPLPIDEALRDALATPAPKDDQSKEKSAERKPRPTKKKRRNT